MLKIATKDERGKFGSKKSKGIFKPGKRRDVSFARSTGFQNKRASKFSEHFSDPERFIKWVESYINSIV